MNNGYIRLHRKIMEWEWYSNINDRLVFIQCLLDANWKDGYFNGEVISRGSFPTSIEKLSGETGLTFSQIRTSLKHLKLTNNITIKSFRHFSIITINNYEKYQDDDKQDGNLIASSSQANDKLIATIEKSKKEKKKESNNKYIVEIIDYLNMRTGQHYKHNNTSTQEHINARLKEGFTVDDFKTVINKKCVEWMGTDMQKYLRPDTLFRPSKFESYLNQDVSEQKDFQWEYLKGMYNGKI